MHRSTKVISVYLYVKSKISLRYNIDRKISLNRDDTRESSQRSLRLRKAAIMSHISEMRGFLHAPTSIFECFNSLFPGLIRFLELDGRAKDGGEAGRDP